MVGGSEEHMGRPGAGKMTSTPLTPPLTPTATHPPPTHLAAHPSPLPPTHIITTHEHPLTSPHFPMEA